MGRTRVWAGAAAIAVFLLAGGCGGNGNGDPGGEDEYFNPDIEYSSFTDPRDGKSYRSVKVGDRTWMAENINYETSASWCYGNDKSNCAKYGRLYGWTDAKLDACPTEAGWRLPLSDDWDDLIKTAGGKDTGGKRLKAKAGWDGDGSGTDNCGFSALPGGSRHPSDGSYSGMGIHGYWWSDDRNGLNMSYYVHLDSANVTVDRNSGFNTVGISVRCVRD